jgi:hypothetical protein
MSQQPVVRVVWTIWGTALLAWLALWWWLLAS